jgi:hypothetical protein
MRSAVTVCLLALGSCQSEPTATIAAKQKPSAADLDLRKASAKLTQTSSTAWTLEKVGSQSGASITWQATATKGTTQSGLLIVNGFFKLENKGKGDATIGNIVVNLQTKNHWWQPWVTRSSVIADATDDDAATSAVVDSDRCNDNTTTFHENAASGHLLFTDAKTNSAFALVPQVSIPGKTSKKLRYSASYDNTVLQLPTWTFARVEILISFGNAKKGKSSAHDVDINGNGVIDPDEEWIQTVDEREYVLVPPSTPSNSTVTLTDTVQDITTTGTVTFSNPVIAITGTNATVVVNYDGGATGGTITNCAHLTGSGQTVTVDDDLFPNVMPINLTACDTQTIGPHTCSPGAPGCGWEDGDMVSYAQDSWGGDPTTSTAAALLLSRFDFVYPTGSVEVGINGVAGFSMIFTAATTILDYQPSSGGPDPLNADLLDPTSTSSGVFGGNVLALRLDVDFSDSGDISGTANLDFGNLRLCGLTATPAYNGLTIRQFLDQMNIALGGGPVAYSFQTVSQLTADVTAAFEGGSASLFAQQHVFSSASCP